MSIFNIYTISFFSMLIIGVAIFLIYFIYKKIEDDKGSDESFGNTTFYNAQNADCIPNDENLFWKYNFGETNPNFLVPDTTVPVGDHIQYSDINWIPYTSTPTTKKICCLLTNADLQQICKDKDNCVGWIKTTARANENECGIYTELPSNIVNRQNELTASCKYDDIYNNIGQVKNEYLNTHKIYPIIYNK